MTNPFLVVNINPFLVVNIMSQVLGINCHINLMKTGFIKYDVIDQVYFDNNKVFRKHNI